MRLGTIRVQVEQDGSTSEVELDLDPNHLTLKEGVRLEKTLGPGAQSLFSGKEIEVSFVMLRALLWAKLTTEYSSIGIDDFDLDLADLSVVDDEPEHGEPKLTSAEIEHALFVEEVDPEVMSVQRTGKV